MHTTAADASSLCLPGYGTEDGFGVGRIVYVAPRILARTHRIEATLLIEDVDCR